KVVSRLKNIGLTNSNARSTRQTFKLAVLCLVFITLTGSLTHFSIGQHRRELCCQCNQKRFFVFVKYPVYRLLNRQHAKYFTVMYYRTAKKGRKTVFANLRGNF